MDVSTVIEEHLVPALLDMKNAVMDDFEFLTEDRPLEPDLRSFAAKIADQSWSLYDEV